MFAPLALGMCGFAGLMLGRAYGTALRHGSIALGGAAQPRGKARRGGETVALAGLGRAYTNIGVFAFPAWRIDRMSMCEGKTAGKRGIAVLQRRALDQRAARINGS